MNPNDCNSGGTNPDAPDADARRGSSRQAVARANESARRAVCAEGEALIEQAIGRFNSSQVDRVRSDMEVRQLLDLVARRTRGKAIADVIKAIMRQEGLPIADHDPATAAEGMLMWCVRAACERLAAIRASSVPSTFQAIEQTAEDLRQECASAQKTMLYDNLVKGVDVCDLGDIEELSAIEDETSLARLIELGLVVCSDNRFVKPSTLTEQEKARDKLEKTLLREVHTRASGYWHPIEGWIRLRPAELSAHEQLHLAALAQEILGSPGRRA